MRDYIPVNPKKEKIMKLKPTAAAFMLASAVLFAGAQRTPAAETYAVDPVHSSVIFRINHLGISYFYGRFNDIAGTFVIDDEDIGAGSADITIKVESLDTHDVKRNGHILGPDFFNAKSFPVITFKSSAIKNIDEKRVEVTGDLTLHGVKKPVKVEMMRIGSGKDPWGGFRSGYEGTLVIKRSDFGMKFMLEGIGDEVTIILSIEGVRK